MDWMLFAAEDSLASVPTTVFGLLSLMVVSMMAALGWMGRLLLVKGFAILKEYAAALKANAAAVNGVQLMLEKHDAGQASHHSSCSDANSGIHALHRAAIELCDFGEDVCKKYDIDAGGKIQRVREALRTKNAVSG